MTDFPISLYIIEVAITLQTIKIRPISDGQRSEIISSYLGHQTALAYVRIESSSNRYVDFAQALPVVINFRSQSLSFHFLHPRPFPFFVFLSLQARSFIS